MNKYYQVIIRIPKADSAFLYFTLEANEGVCYYSTLDSEVGSTFRDIDIQGAPEFYPDLLNILKHLDKDIEINFLKKEACCEL